MRPTVLTLFLAFAMSVLVGCASTPETLKKDQITLAPTYTEKVSAVIAEDARGVVCPKDNMWEGLEWKKIIPLANGCVRTKDWAKVERMADHLAKKAHLTPWGAYYFALSASARKDFPRAQWMLELALKKDPKQGMFHYEAGRIHWELGDETQALKSLKMASDLNPSLTEAHYIMGQMALLKGQHTEAETLLLKALNSDTRHWPTLMTLAVLKTKTGDWTKAAEYLARAVDLNPHSSKARVALAQIQETHLKKPNEALRSYRELKQLAAARKLDESVSFNVDEKIKMIEATTREPSSFQGKAKK